ncbi:uncharacterized protein LOC135701317 [Ochlerotatus camptorhynchus]|uniref:uncharacterized protein LOC135701317 n=1 Tax=Ochlerotatus camptorhynchus TaxID=644619 RepID=UPI0031DD25A4
MQTLLYTCRNRNECSGNYGTVIRPEILTRTEQTAVGITADQATPLASAFPTVKQSGFYVENVDLTLASTSNPVASPSQLVLESAASISSDTDSNIGPENPEETPNSSNPQAFSGYHFSPEVLKRLLSGTVIGTKILSNAEAVELTEASRKLVTDVIARYHLEINRKSSFEVLDEYAEVIIKIFKKEKKSTYCSHRKHRNPGGKLYSRINYIRQSERKRIKEEDDHVKGIKQPDTNTRVANPEALNAISWLQLNRSPWSSVLVQWEISFPERCRDLKNSNKFSSVLESYPHLSDETGYQLLDIDFRLLGYGDPAVGERKWRTLIDDIALYIAKHAKDPSAKELLQILRNPDYGIDVRLCATLLGLNTVLIPVKAAKGFKPTVATAQNETFWLCLDGNAAQSKLEAERSLWNKQAEPEIPKLIVFGASLEIVSPTCFTTTFDIWYCQKVRNITEMVVYL